MKLALTEYAQALHWYTEGVVHQVLCVTVTKADLRSRRYHFACHILLGVAEVNFLHYSKKAVDCIACLAQKPYLLRCKGWCGAWLPPEEMHIHRDTFEVFCMGCAANVNKVVVDQFRIQAQG